MYFYFLFLLLLVKVKKKYRLPRLSTPELKYKGLGLNYLLINTILTFPYII